MSERPQGETPVAADPRSLRINALASVVGHLSFFGVIFLTTPLAVRSLGPEDWGIWQLVGALTAYAFLLDLGFGTAIHQQVAVQSAKADYERLARVFTSLRLYLFAVAVLIALILFSVGRPLVAAMIEPEHVDVAYATLTMSVLLTAALLPMRLYPSALAGLQRLDLYGFYRVVSALAFYGAVVFGFRHGMGLVAFAAIMTLAPQLAAFPAWWSVRRRLPRESLRFTRVDVSLFLGLTRYSMSTLLFTTGSIVLYQTMKFVAAWKCGGAEAAGQMGLVITVVQALAIVFTPSIGVLHARVGQMHGEGRDAEIPDLLARALGVAGLLIVPSVVFLSLDADAIFAAWLGDSVAAFVLADLGETARYMFVGQGLYLLALPCYYALLGIGEHRIFGTAMVVVAVANSLAGAAAASATTRIESIGFVFGLLTSVLALVVVFPAALRRFPMSIAGVAKQAIALPLLACVPGVVAVYFGPQLEQPILDLALDAALFGLLSLPGLEFARRRLR